MKGISFLSWELSSVTASCLKIPQEDKDVPSTLDNISCQVQSCSAYSCRHGYWSTKERRTQAGRSQWSSRTAAWSTRTGHPTRYHLTVGCFGFACLAKRNQRQHGVYSNSRAAERDMRGAPAFDASSTRLQTALPPRGKAGSERGEKVSKARREWRDTDTAMGSDLRNKPHVKPESVDGKALSLDHELSEAGCKTAAPTPTSEQRNLGQKLRFNFQMAPFALRSKSDGHPSNVMETLFKQPVDLTVFDVPEYQGPWSHKRAPKWTMGISDASGPKEGKSCCCLNRQTLCELGKPVYSLELFHLSSPMYGPVSYPSWRANIRAAWVLLGRHYKVQNSRRSKSNTRVTIALPRDANEGRSFSR